jgi:hypothetical protein
MGSFVFFLYAPLGLGAFDGSKLVDYMVLCNTKYMVGKVFVMNGKYLIWN